MERDRERETICARDQVKTELRRGGGLKSCCCGPIAGNPKAVCMLKRFPNQVQSIRPNQVRSKLLISGLDWWKASAGHIRQHDKQLNALFPSLQICAENGRDWPPPLLCVGPQGDFARLFGGKFVNALAEAPNAIQDSQGYLQVRQTRQPVIEHVRSRPVNVGEDRVWVSYERLIVPGSLASNRELYLVLNKIERVLRDVGGAEEVNGR